ncbi:MAG: hypothetical protein K9M57_08965 [Phycisphaerae bacterium]|nr:hypothetical protein [Phycisphaerae bacterium]
MILNICAIIITVILMVWFIMDCRGRGLWKRPFGGDEREDMFKDYLDGVELGNLFAAGKFTEIIPKCDEMLKTQPYNEEALRYKAYCLYHGGQLQESLKLFKRTSTFPSEHVNSYQYMIGKIEGELNGEVV